MNIRHDNEEMWNSELIRRFTQIRAEDAEQLPAFPDEELLAKRSPIIAKPRFYAAVPSMAAAMAAAMLVGVLFIERTPEDPSRVYAEIMSANNMDTDQLMAVSTSVLPEMTSLPGIFEINAHTGGPGIVN